MDGHGDVTALIDVTSKAIVATYYYDAFGNIISQTGDVNNSITYSGYQYDDETGYYYLNARMYDPKVARFLQEDTYRGNPNDPLSLNLYTYSANNPIRYYDPSGHFWEDLLNIFGGDDSEDQSDTGATFFDWSFNDLNPGHKAQKDYINNYTDSQVINLDSVFGGVVDWWNGVFDRDTIIENQREKNIEEHLCVITPASAIDNVIAGNGLLIADASQTFQQVVNEPESILYGMGVMYDILNNPTGQNAMNMNISISMGFQEFAKSDPNTRIMLATPVVEEAATVVVPLGIEGLQALNATSKIDDMIRLGMYADDAVDTADNIVYRALNQKDADRLSQGLGLEAKNPNGTWTLEEHVVSGSNKSSWVNDPYISTTSDLTVAQGFDEAGSNLGVIEIDLNQVSSPTYNGYEIFPRATGVDGLPYHYSVWQQETSIFQYIPYEAIKEIK